MPLISIAMATYNGEKYIEEQINSILTQSFQDFELIIHDDGSKDRTYEIIKAFSEQDRRIIVSRNASNLGFAKNFESIILDCTGKFIAFSDQDDIWERDHLKVLMNIIGEHDVACGNALLVSENGDSLGMTMRDVIGMNINPTMDDIFDRLCYDNFVQGSCMMVRTDLCLKCLPIPSIVKFHDYWIALMAAVNGGISYSSEVILRYRQHENNVTQNQKTSLIREIYNALSGFTGKHFLRQKDILKVLVEMNPDSKTLQEAYQFYFNCSSKNIQKADRQYFKSHYRGMFLTDDGYWWRNIVYLRLMK